MTTNRRSGLGRGLSSLIPTEYSEEATADAPLGVHEVPIAAEAVAASHRGLNDAVVERAYAVGQRDGQSFDVTTPRQLVCPQCRAETHGTPFCPDCGFRLAQRHQQDGGPLRACDFLSGNRAHCASLPIQFLTSCATRFGSWATACLAISSFSSSV